MHLVQRPGSLPELGPPVNRSHSTLDFLQVLVAVSFPLTCSRTARGERSCIVFSDQKLLHFKRKHIEMITANICFPSLQVIATYLN